MERVLKKLLYILCMLNLYSGQISAADIELYPVYGKLTKTELSKPENIALLQRFERLGLKFASDGSPIYSKKLKSVADLYTHLVFTRKSTSVNELVKLNLEEIDKDYNKISESIAQFETTKLIGDVIGVYDPIANVFITKNGKMSPAQVAFSVTKVVYDVCLKQKICTGDSFDPENNPWHSAFKDSLYLAGDLLSLSSNPEIKNLSSLGTGFFDKLAVGIMIYDGILKSAKLTNAIVGLVRIAGTDSESLKNLAQQQFINEYLYTYKSNIDLMTKRYQTNKVIDKFTFLTLFQEYINKNTFLKENSNILFADNIYIYDLYFFLLENSRFSPSLVEGNYNYSKTVSKDRPLHIFMTYQIKQIEKCKIDWLKSTITDYNAKKQEFQSNYMSIPPILLNQKINTLSIECNDLTKFKLNDISIPTKPSDYEIYKNSSMLNAYKALANTNAIDTSNEKFSPSMTVNASAVVKFSYKHMVPLKIYCKDNNIQNCKEPTSWDKCITDGLCSNGYTSTHLNIFSLQDSSVTRDQLAQFICTYTNEILRKPLCTKVGFNTLGKLSKIGTNDKSKLPLNIMKFQGTSKVTRGEAILIINRVKNAIK